LVLAGKVVGMERDSLLELSDEELLAQCRVERIQGTGRGGQKRNRTFTKVRLTLPNGVTAASDATRSQHRNRDLALRALRQTLALSTRCAPSPEFSAASPAPASLRSCAYALWLARLLDAWAAHHYRAADLAQDHGISTAQAVATAFAHPPLWRAIAAARQSAGLRPLRAPRS
jgi:hypothetical protein